MDKFITTWLLSSEPWVQYRTRLDLLEQPEDNPEVRKNRSDMLSHPSIIELIEDLLKWPEPVLKRHNDAGHLIHKLSFLAEIGLQRENPGILDICNKILSHKSETGVFQILLNIPAHFGGSGTIIGSFSTFY